MTVADTGYHAAAQSPFPYLPMRDSDDDCEIHVLMSSDAGYGEAVFRPFFWALRHANKGERIHIHYLLVDGTDAFRRMIASFCEKNGLACSIYDVGTRLVDAFKDGEDPKGWFVLAVYGRLFLGDFLPVEVRQVVYMDADMICCGRLRELLRLAESSPLAAVPDVARVMAGEEGYFNNGMMVIDVEAWRQQDAFGRLKACFDEGRSKGIRHQFPEQDLLNIVFADKWRRVPYAWNFLAINASISQNIIAFYKNNQVRRPQICHFVGGGKPWKGDLNWAVYQRAASMAYGRALAFSTEGAWARSRQTALWVAYAVLSWRQESLSPGTLRWRLLVRVKDVVRGDMARWPSVRWLGSAINRKGGRGDGK